MQIHNIIQSSIEADLSHPLPIMNFHKLFRPSVCVDLSRTPPIYRPWVGVPHIRIFFETALSTLRGFPAIQIEKLRSIISFNSRFQKCSKKS
jgi:hypothetical protein